MNKRRLVDEIYLFSKDDNPKNIVIFSHSLSKNYESDLSWAILESLYEKNIGVVVFNFDFFKKNIKPSNNLIDEVVQLDSIISLVKDRFRPDKISLVGISLGGVISAMCCTEGKNEEVLSIFIVGFPFKLGFPPNISLLQDSDPVMPDYFLEYKQLFDLINKRVFVIQGDNDDLGGVSDCIGFFNKYDNCSVFKVQGANHGFTSYKDDGINFFNVCSKFISSKLII